jgi:hypothetical protein
MSPPHVLHSISTGVIYRGVTAVLETCYGDHHLVEVFYVHLRRKSSMPGNQSRLDSNRRIPHRTLWTIHVGDPTWHSGTPDAGYCFSLTEHLCDAETGKLEDLITNYKNVFAMKSIEYRQTNRVYHHITYQWQRSMTNSVTPNGAPSKEEGRSGKNAQKHALA